MVRGGGDIRVFHPLLPFTGLYPAGKTYIIRKCPVAGGESMIGDMIGELTGKITGQRLKRHHMGVLKIERTMESKGKVLGTEVTFLATFKSWERPQGGMFSKGNGLMMTAAGERADFHGSGISVAGKGHGISMRGIRYAQSAAPPLSRLNNIAMVFEIEVSPDGTVHDRMWEWK